MLCLFGVCIPYSVLWPLALIFLKHLWDRIEPFVRPFLGFKKVANEDKPKPAALISSEEVSSRITEITKGQNGIVIQLENDLDFKYLLNSTSPLVVKFTADWCKPCKALNPFVESLAKKYTSIHFLSIDVDKFDTLAAEHGASLLPFFASFKGGSKVRAVATKNEIEIRGLVLGLLQ